MVLVAMLLKVEEAVLAVDETKLFKVLETPMSVEGVVVGSPISGTAKCVPKTAFAFRKLCKRMLSAN